MEITPSPFDHDFGLVADMIRLHARRDPARRALVDAHGEIDYGDARRADGPRRRRPAARRRRCRARRSRSAPQLGRAMRRSSSAPCAPASSSRRSPRRSRRRAFAAHARRLPAPGCCSSTRARPRWSATRGERAAASSRSTRSAGPRLRRLARPGRQRAAAGRRSRPDMAVQHHLFVGHDRHAEGHRPAARACAGRTSMRGGRLRLRRRTRSPCWRRRSTRTPRWSCSSRPSRSAARVVLMAKFDAERYLALAEQHRVTHTMLVPVQYQRLMAQPALRRATTCRRSGSSSAPARRSRRR